MDHDTLIIRWAFLVINVIYWLGGGVVLGVGLWLSLNPDAFDILAVLDPESSSYLIWRLTVYGLSGIGAIIFTAGFIGMSGALCMAKRLLVAYCTLSIICLVGEIGCAAVAVIYGNSVDSQLALAMFQDISTKYTNVNDEDNSYVTSWNRFQSLMSCCGSYNFTDWHKNTNYDPSAYETVPWTCCKMAEVHEPPLLSDVIDEVACYNEGKGSDPASQPGFNFLHTKSCHDVLGVWLKDVGLVIFCTMLSVATVQMAVIFTGCMLYCTARRT